MDEVKLLKYMREKLKSAKSQLEEIGQHQYDFEIAVEHNFIGPMQNMSKEHMSNEDGAIAENLVRMADKIVLMEVQGIKSRYQALELGDYRGATSGWQISCHYLAEEDKTDEDIANEIVGEEDYKYVVKLKKPNGKILKVAI